MLLQVSSVFALAFVSFSGSIPAGLALGLAPVVVAVTAALSYATSVVLVVVLGERLRARLLARFGGKLANDPQSRVRKVWDRYGMVGLALLAPMTTGGPIGAVIGLAFGAAPRRLIVWMSLGAAVWSTLLTTVIMLGVRVVASP